MERQESQILTETALKKISQAITDRLQAQIKGKPVNVKNSIQYCSTKNEVVILIVRKVESRVGDIEEEFHIWLVMVNLDNLSSPDKDTVFIHQLFFERAERINGSGRWGEAPCSKFNFAPTDFVLNNVETSFVIYGLKGICVGNLPTQMSRLKQKSELNCQIQVELVSVQEDWHVLKAEFSFLNTNYLLCLTQNLSNDDTYLRVFNLSSNGMGQEIEILVSTDWPMNSISRKNEKIVSFTQCNRNAAELNSLDVFQITFLTEQGTVLSLCPVLLQQIVLTEEHFSSILLQIGDLIDEGQDLKKLKNAIIHGKSSLKNMTGFCQIKISVEDQILLKPKLLKYSVANIERRIDSKHSDLICLCSMPSTFLRVNQCQADLLMTYAQPAFLFTKDQVKPLESLILISQVNIPSQEWSVEQDKINSETCYLKNSQAVFKLDLSCIQQLKSSFYDGVTFEMSTFEGMKSRPVKIKTDQLYQVSVCKNYIFHITSNLQICLQSSLTFDEVKVEQFKRQLFTIEQQSQDQIQSLSQINTEMKWQMDKAFEQKLIKDEISGDITVDSFKQFMEWLDASYCSHFETLNPVFEQRKKYILGLEDQLLKQMESITKLQQSNQQNKIKVDDGISNLERKNQLIQEKLASIKEKIGNLSHQMPNDFVLQVFIAELADKVSQRKNNLNATLKRAKQQQEFEMELREAIQKMCGAQIDREQLKAIYSFINSRKPQVEELQSKFKNMLA